MESRIVSIYLFVIAGFLVLLASIINNEWLLILSKPMIIPALLAYYFFSEKKVLSLELVFVLLVYFVSDAIALVKLEGITSYLVVLDYIPYIMLIKVVTEDAFKIGFCKVNFSLSIFYFIILMVAMYFLLDAFSMKSIDLTFACVSYGIVLGLFVSISSYNFLMTNFSEIASLVFLAASFSLVADVIFVFTNMVLNVKALTYIEFALQIISYFYIVAYFIDRENMYLDTNMV
ncbi:hypothetical protein [Flavobacterium sp. GCM10023249]|uniref:hypothetical protein n=1 Tax=unclassified Flavobacterium TaxID=196869 RepID=UPI00361222FC